jgi:hypothetical protein
MSHVGRQLQSTYLQTIAGQQSCFQVQSAGSTLLPYGGLKVPKDFNSNLYLLTTSACNQRICSGAIHHWALQFSHESELILGTSLEIFPDNADWLGHGMG